MTQIENTLYDKNRRMVQLEFMLISDKKRPKRQTGIHNNAVRYTDVAHDELSFFRLRTESCFQRLGATTKLHDDMKGCNQSMHAQVAGTISFIRFWAYDNRILYL